MVIWTSKKGQSDVFDLRVGCPMVWSKIRTCSDFSLEKSPHIQVQIFFQEESLKLRTLMILGCRLGLLY
jgi:hypothetical protein